VDDAFISFRYAAHWAEGSGLTWNPGEPVEGFSNPTWTLLLGVAARTGVRPERAAIPLSVLCLVLMTLTVAALGRRAGLGLPARWTLLGGAALDGGLLLWSGSGLETAWVALLVAWTLLAAVAVAETGGGDRRTAWTLGILSGLLAVSRPEGGLWAGLILAWLIWGVWAPGGSLTAWLLGAAPIWGAYEGFRWSTYGRLVPNTFFAKVEPGTTGWVHGLTGLVPWAAAHGVLLLGVVALLRFPPPDRWVSRTRFAFFLGAWVLVQGGFVVAVGGDWMGATRYPAPLAPVLALLAALGVQRVVPDSSLRRTIPAAILLAAAYLGLGWTFRDRIPTYTPVASELGRWLKGAARPGDRLAVTAAGAIPYYADLQTYDVLGLNDPSVAGRAPHRTAMWAPGHDRYDLDRLLALDPTWIVWDYGVGANRARLRKLRSYTGDPDSLDYRRALLARPAFRKRYRIDMAAPRRTRGAYTVFRRR